MENFYGFFWDSYGKSIVVVNSYEYWCSNRFSVGYVFLYLVLVFGGRWFLLLESVVIMMFLYC